MPRCRSRKGSRRIPVGLFRRQRGYRACGLVKKGARRRPAESATEAENRAPEAKIEPFCSMNEASGMYDRPPRVALREVRSTSALWARTEACGARGHSLCQRLRNRPAFVHTLLQKAGRATKSPPTFFNVTRPNPLGFPRPVA
jgi:hypothetical protein